MIKFYVFLLQELEKGRYASTDVYVHHMTIVPDRGDTLILTDKRVLYIERNDIFGGWQVLEPMQHHKRSRWGGGYPRLGPKSQYLHF